MPAPAAPEPGGAPLWPWIAALAGLLGLGELARRWFWPKPKLGCEIAIGPGAITGASQPLVGAPEVQFDFRIELGEVRTGGNGG